MEGVFLDAHRLALEKKRGIWPDRVLTDYLDRWVAERPEATAILAFRDDRGTATRLTWRELAQAAAAVARGLLARGVAKGDVVSFQLPNWWEFAAIHLACVRIGAVSNPLMPIFRHRELSFMVAHAESKVLIAPTVFRGFDHGALALDLKRRLPALEHVFLVGGEGEHSFEAALLAGMRDAPVTPGAELAPNDIVQLLYTSGTTGEPKGAMHTSNTLIGSTLTFAERMRLGADDVVFMPSPLAHQIGFEYGLLVSVLVGAPLVLMDAWNPERAVGLMEQHRATYMFAATPFLADLASFPDIETRSLGDFRLFVASGAPIPPVLVRAAQEKLREQEGTRQGRGPGLFGGYLKRPHLYDVDADGWFDTGDIARMDLEGYIRICGRKKDIIIRGGENIPVVQIESALYKMPQVSEVAIVAMPDTRLGERACAFVTLRPGERLALKDVKTFLTDEGVAKQFWPERLEIVDQMPRTPTGKIQKFVLREMAKALTVQQRE